MKKYIIYSSILVVGLLIGWFTKGASETEKHIHKDSIEVNAMWTCSMHPQILQAEAGDCPICGMDLVPVTTNAEGLLANQFRLSSNAMALANIQTSVVGGGSTEGNAIKLSGIIAVNEKENAVQTSYFSGRIERLNVSFTGEEIRKGQLLATIYSPELVAAQQELITASSLKESQPALYNAVRNKLKFWKLSDKQINQIETSAKVKENFPVYATVSGTVSEKLVAQGDYIKKGQVLLKISNLNTVWANFDMYENQIGVFKKGQKISIHTNTNTNKEVLGKISFIDPILNTKTRTLKIRVVLDNRNKVFKPGMFVEGTLFGVDAKNKETLQIPSSSVLWTGERSVVYIKTTPKKPVFELRSVVLGNMIGDSYEVLKGLAKGDVIVTNGAFTVDAAAQLQGKKSMMNKSGGKVLTGHEGHIGRNNQNTSNIKRTTIKVKRIQVVAQFQKQLKEVFESYINIKNALVKDDMESAMDGAKEVLNKLQQVDMGLLNSPDAHKQWMPLKSKINNLASFIANATSIKEVRGHFKGLSSQLSLVIQVFGVNAKVYSQFCPMADANKGAFWLSKQGNVFNPYFGNAMLNCGEVQQIIE